MRARNNNNNNNNKNSDVATDSVYTKCGSKETVTYIDGLA